MLMRSRGPEHNRHEGNRQHSQGLHSWRQGYAGEPFRTSYSASDWEQEEATRPKEGVRNLAQSRASYRQLEQNRTFA